MPRQRRAWSIAGDWAGRSTDDGQADPAGAERYVEKRTTHTGEKPTLLEWKPFVSYGVVVRQLGVLSNCVNPCAGLAVTVPRTEWKRPHAVRTSFLPGFHAAQFVRDMVLFLFFGQSTACLQRHGT